MPSKGLGFSQRLSVYLIMLREGSCMPRFYALFQVGKGHKNARITTVNLLSDGTPEVFSARSKLDGLLQTLVEKKDDR